jgi:hypothetical protein
MAPRKGCCMNLEDWHAAAHDRQVGSQSRQRVCDCATYAAAAAGHHGVSPGQWTFCRSGYGVRGGHAFSGLVLKHLGRSRGGLRIAAADEPRLLDDKLKPHFASNEPAC